MFFVVIAIRDYASLISFNRPMAAVHTSSMVSGECSLDVFDCVTEYEREGSGCVVCPWNDDWPWLEH